MCFSVFHHIPAQVSFAALLVASVGKGAAASISHPNCNATFDRVYREEVESRVDNMNLDSTKFHYMDFTGSGVFLNRQVSGLTDIYSSGVFGNPHSKSKSSSLSTDYVDGIRKKIFAFFSADPDEYWVIFTRSATGAIVLLGDAFPFSANSSFAYTQANHASVLGIRSIAKSKGASIDSMTEEDVEAWIATAPSSNSTGLTSSENKSYSLFAYPAKENWGGVMYPLQWIERVQNMSNDDHEWLVLLDAAAYIPSKRLNLSEVKPDFVDISFYKLFGFPTGVGALIMRKDSERKLSRTYWGGSSIYVATSSEDWLLRYNDHSKWEDGTLPFMEIASMETGFEAIEYLGGIDAIAEHVDCVGKFLSAKLQSLKHSNGRPMILLYGNHYNNTSQQSYSTSNFNIVLQMSWQRLDSSSAMAACAITVHALVLLD